MEVVGKCPPESAELEAAEERGFDKVELYTTREHFDNLEKTLEDVKEADVEVVSVHTPHVHIDNDKAYFWMADYLCREIDAYLVFHSQYMHHAHIPQLEELKIKSDYGYENNPGASKEHITANILEKDYQMVLDTAHFFMAEENYLEEIEGLLDSYGDQIDLIHLCDSTMTDDGLAFGEGEMDMEAVSRIIDESGLDGILVLEVMPEDQRDAREKFERYTA
ncbi:Xylose isomerase domain protein TIM barrel [Candidatus Haloredivivus sp. G17]|jgi:sugar phosphate isomerase/epimerase|nr:Xylose isomerase domain protein TIM barrel [Candidatus Haloredivivus sp. G17]